MEQIFDIKHVDKDALQRKFGHAILSKNTADQAIITKLLIIKEKLNLKDTDRLWRMFNERLCYPLYTKCVNNEPLVDAEIINHELILSGEVVCISDMIQTPPGNIKTRLRINCGVFVDMGDSPTFFVHLIKENVATILNILSEHEQELSRLIKGDSRTQLNPEIVSRMVKERDIVQELQKSLFKPSVQIEIKED